MKVVEEMCNKIHDIKPFRIKAAMMEKFHHKSEMLAKCYEDILKIDPTCVTTLKKLIVMSKEVGYSRESLIEMIALHVEASFPDAEIWKEFAEVLILVFENGDEDRICSATPSNLLTLPPLPPQPTISPSSSIPDTTFRLSLLLFTRNAYSGKESLRVALDSSSKPVAFVSLPSRLILILILMLEQCLRLSMEKYLY
ncbi:hypothetical protein Bca101_096736 [Brassica carinata]